MTNSLGQMTLNSSSILTTGVPVSGAQQPKLVIQALPTMLPAGSKAGEKITIITIPANQLAALMPASASAQVAQLIHTKPSVTTSTVHLAGAPAVGRAAPQLILAKPAVTQLAVQSGTLRTLTQQPQKLVEAENVHSSQASSSSPPQSSTPAESSSSWETGGSASSPLGPHRRGVGAGRGSDCGHVMRKCWTKPPFSPNVPDTELHLRRPTMVFRESHLSRRGRWTPLKRIKGIVVESCRQKNKEREGKRCALILSELRR